MAAEFDLYVRRDTWVHDLDPRVKILFVLEGVMLAFLWRSIWPALGTAACCLALVVAARVPPLRLGRFLRGVAPLLLLVFLLTALFGGASGAVWLRLGPVQVSPSGLYQAALLVARLLAVGLVLFLWLSTTDQRAMVAGFVGLGMPYDWGLTLALALRYLPIVGGLFQQVLDAQQARGLDLAQKGLPGRLRAYRPVLIAVVIGALRHGERLGWALESRALAAPGVRRTTYRPLRFRRHDLAALVLLAVLLAGTLALRVS